MKKMSTGLSVYYDGYGSYDSPKNFFLIKPLKGIKKNYKIAHVDNLTTKKMSTRPGLYYDGCGSYDFPKMKFCLMQISSVIVCDVVPSMRSSIKSPQDIFYN